MTPATSIIALMDDNRPRTVNDVATKLRIDPDDAQHLMTQLVIQKQLASQYTRKFGQAIYRKPQA